MGDPRTRLGLDLDEEQLLVADAARSYARERLAPGASARDHDEELPPALLGELGALGLLSVRVPVQDGGAGADGVALALALEAVAESCASTATLLSSTNVAAEVLASCADAAQRARWLVPYAEGRLGAASLALAEPGASLDVGAIDTVASEEDGAFVLEGRKDAITGAGEAGLHVVFARVAGRPREGGLACFVVERGTPGLVVSPAETSMGLRGTATRSLAFDRCRVPREHLLGAVGDGAATASAALARGHLGMGAVCVGIAEAALRAGLSHASEREAFGQRLTHFENTRHVLARSRTELDAAWLMVLRAARLEGGERTAAAECAMAKLFASETCGRVVDAMLQLHGGYGYSREYAIERLYRDARGARLRGGTTEAELHAVASALLSG